MRKILLSAVVCFLFLLVPASMIRAQTAYVTGTVSEEPNYRDINFHSEYGDVKIIVPGDLNGPGQGTITITGTVTPVPAGNTEKIKSANLRILQKMSLTIAGNSITVSASRSTFQFLVPANSMSSLNLSLKDVAGHFAELSLKNPVIPVSPMTGNLPPGQPSLLVDQKVYLSGGNIPVYAANNTSTLFQPTDKFFMKDATGKTAEAIVLSQSPTQTVLKAPEGFPTGPMTIQRQASVKTDQVQVRTVDLTLSASDNNLRNGQTATLTVTIDPKITDKDSAEAMQIPVMSLDLKNLTPGVIEMSNGNIQVMRFPTGPGTSASFWQTTRIITGVKPGGFNVSADLYPSSSNSTNPALTQMHALENTEEFNLWIAAVKKQLSDLLKTISATDNKELISNTSNSLRFCSREDELNLYKMMAGNLLRTFNIPGFDLTTSLPAFVAYQAASQHLVTQPSASRDFVHTDIIKDGLNYLQKTSSTTGNDLKTNEKINDARQATDALDNNYSGEQLNTLSLALQTLNNTGLVTGQTAVATILDPLTVDTDGPVGAHMNGNEITTDRNQVEVYDDNAIIVFGYINGKLVRYTFFGIPASGTTLKALLQEYINPSYPMPYLVDCDSLRRICKKTQALDIFWGDVYSVFNGSEERRIIKGETIEKETKSSLLITRGWKIDCCTGEYSLWLTCQAMQGNSASISFKKKLAYGFDCPPLPNDCPECKKKCEDWKNLQNQHR